MSIEDILMNDRDAANEMAEIMLSMARELKGSNQVTAKKVIRDSFDIINNVKEFIRPAIIIQDDHFKLPNSQSVSGRMRNDEAKKNILSAIRASGKIEAEETGTAWVIAKNIIVTNRHVVMNNNDIHNSFKNKKALVNFKSEYNINNETFRFAIEKVLYIDNEYDIAFIAVDFKESLPPKPIRVTGEAKENQDVCVIGYPTKPRDSSDIEEEIFRFNDTPSKNGVKRISPGKIFALDNKLHHDCSTSGGSSGSVVFDYIDSTAVGIHYSGSRNKNSFVPARIIADRLKKILS